MSNLKDKAWRYGPEATIGAAVTDPLQDMILTTMKPTGGSGPKRTASGGVNPSQMVRDYVPEYAECTIAHTAPSLYNHNAPLRAAVCGQPSSYSGGLITTYTSALTTTLADITAVASGNKLHTAAGAWAAFPVGSVVQVSGFAGGSGKNPVLFCARVASISGSDLFLSWPTLVNETPAGSVTVSNAGQLRFGTTLQTFFFESFNSVRSYGDTYSTVGVKDWTVTTDIKTAEMSEAFNFVCGASPAPITAAVANTTIAAPTVYVHNSNVDFGDKTHPTYGGGFRYNGVVYTPGSGSGQIRINKVTHKVTRAVTSSGGVGAFGPLSLYTDGYVEVMLDLEVMRDSAQAEQMLADRANNDTVVEIGYAVIDGNGKRLYRLYPSLQYDTGDSSQGTAQTGEDWISFPMKAKENVAMGTPFQETLLG